MKKSIKLALKIAVPVIVALVLAVAIYVIYFVSSYSRLDSVIDLEVQNLPGVETEVKRNTIYTATTLNIGFGAYSQDFSFFMDGGDESRGRSEDEVNRNIDSLAQAAFNTDANFLFFQEVDTDADRSFHINQKEKLSNLFYGLSTVYAQNYQSPYIFYPVFSPHGASESGMMTMSDFKIESATRYSIPVSDSFSKYLDLDRCYTKSTVSAEGGKKLVLYNVHMSAYGAGEDVRRAQFEMLFEDMEKEYKKGNYCIVGGDFNCDFTGDSVEKLNGKDAPSYEWAKPFPDELLPQGFSKCTDYKSLEPSCRNCDSPYEKGNYTIVVDGFLVSENVEAVKVENIDTEFTYSDHNPVVLVFKLK